MKSDLNLSLMKGLVIGVGVGVFILLAACVTAFLLYRYYKQLEKSGLRPINIYGDDSPNIVSPRFSRANHPSSSTTTGRASSAQPSAAATAANLVEAAILTDSSTGLPLTVGENMPTIQEDSYETLDSEDPEPPKNRSAALNHDYGTMESASTVAPSSDVVYYSFSPNQPYTDSEGEHDDFESDSEMGE